jgi:hypothetical protein
MACTAAQADAEEQTELLKEELAVGDCLVSGAR